MKNSPFNMSKPATYSCLLTKLLIVYRRPGLTPGKGQNIFNCDYLRGPRPGQVCNVDIKYFGPCTAENDFNYHKAGPCVFLKLNKVNQNFIRKIEN